MEVVLPQEQVQSREVGGVGDADTKVTATSGDLWPGHQPLATRQEPTLMLYTVAI